MSECLHTKNTAVTPGGAERPQGSAVLEMRWWNQSFLCWYRVRIPVLPVWDESETLMRSSTATQHYREGLGCCSSLWCHLVWLRRYSGYLMMTTGTTDCTVGVFCSKTHTHLFKPRPLLLVATLGWRSAVEDDPDQVNWWQVSTVGAASKLHIRPWSHGCVCQHGGEEHHKASNNYNYTINLPD